MPADAPSELAFSSYYETPRLALLSLLDGWHPRRVLEIGCGAGANLAVLKRQTPTCTTTGVELDARAAAVARTNPSIDRLIEGDVLSDAFVPFEQAGFDLIVLSHVLEHFAYPDRVLEQCLGWLEDGGRMLVALPNVRHATVLVDLLVRGDFRYQSCGILDQTHLRFFTRTSALRLLHEHGLETVKVEGEIQGRKFRLLDRITLGTCREFTAFAYNILAIKPR